MKACHTVTAVSLGIAALLVSAQADTLTKRDGSSWAGTWLGYENDIVKFQVNDQILAYPRTDVSSVLFGATPAQQSFAPIPEPQVPPIGYTGKQVPQYLGVVYLQDSGGVLIPLEKTEAKVKVSALRTRYNYQIAGAKSAVRMKSGTKMVFVVRLANGIDPNSITLNVLAKAKDTRRVEMDPDQKNLAFLTIPVNVTKMDDSTYGLSPASALQPGEYAFSPSGANTAYCFGVDPAINP